MTKRTAAVRWTLGIALVLLVLTSTYFYYRASYTHTKRLRVVTPGAFYRCGRMDGSGFEHAIKTYKIRTVINLMDEEPDPQLKRHYLGGGTMSERAICSKYGAKYVFLPINVVPAPHEGDFRPRTIDRFLKIMDDPKNHPVLLHCRAGLHRTGVLTAVWRMEYHKWTPTQAWHELRQNGFGETNCYADNPYIRQYVFGYEPGWRRPRSAAEGHRDFTPLDALVRRVGWKEE